MLRVLPHSVRILSLPPALHLEPQQQQQQGAVPAMWHIFPGGGRRVERRSSSGQEVWVHNAEGVVARLDVRLVRVRGLVCT